VIPEQVGIPDIGLRHLCRLTSRILNTEAPRRAALVRKPARGEWAPKSAALSPIRNHGRAIAAVEAHCGAGVRYLMPARVRRRVKSPLKPAGNDQRLSTIHEGGMSHAAKPAPASTPNAKTAAPVITWTGVRDAKVARRRSAMGMCQRQPEIP
jgi:hypothetical protein